jgi:hypothetical protein
MNKNGGDEPIGFIIHIHMELSQGNFLCSYLNKQKCHFFFNKIREQESRPGSVWGYWYQ